MSAHLSLDRSRPWLVLALTQTVLAVWALAMQATCSWASLNGFYGALSGVAMGYWAGYFLTRKVERIEREARQ